MISINIKINLLILKTNGKIVIGSTKLLSKRNTNISHMFRTIHVYIQNYLQKNVGQQKYFEFFLRFDIPVSVRLTLNIVHVLLLD